MKRIAYTVQIVLACCLPVVMGQQAQSSNLRIENNLTSPKITEKPEDSFGKFIFSLDFKEANPICQLVNLKFKAPGQSKVYLTHLTFMDATTKTMMAQTESAEMINESVVSRMQLIANGCPFLVLEINHPKHKLANTDANVNKLMTFFGNVNLTTAEKVQQIISEMKGPNRIDGIVFGQYLEKKDTISFSLVVVSNTKKSIVSRNLIFDNKPFLCTDPQNSSIKILCQSAHQKITEVFQELLEAL